jgi:hypothetical protein
VSTSKQKRRDKRRKNQASARRKNKGGGSESTRTASGEQSKGLANDRNTNVETERDALTTIDQSQTQPDRWNDRNISQPDIPTLVIDRPNWNPQTYHHTREITIKTTEIISGIPGSRPDDGNTPSLWRGMGIKYWLWLILLCITLMGAAKSEDARVALKKLLDAVAEVIAALNKFRP